MDIYQQRSKCLNDLHNLLIEEVDKECASHDKTYSAPFKKMLERIIERFIEENEMKQLFGQSNMSVSVKVIRSAKVEGSYTIFVLVGNGIFYEKINHDGITHETTTENASNKSIEDNPIPIPTKK